MRIPLPRVIPLEVWELPCDGKLLQEWRDDATFPDRLASAVRDLLANPPATFAPPARTALANVAHFHVLGGGISDATVHALARLYPVTSTADAFAAARAGCTIGDAIAARSHAGRIDEHATHAPTGVDVGQTSIKLAHGNRTWRFERDFARAPFRDDVPDADRARARDATVDYLGELLATAPSPQVVVGLPCELDERGVPRSCTYCWPDLDEALVDDLARRSGKTLAIVNDAELAALAAIPFVPTGATALVVTVGFGVGGAVLLP